MEIHHLIGLLGMITLQGSSLLQIIKFIRSRETAGVAVSERYVILLGLICYLVYSIVIRDWLYILSNSVGIILKSITIIMFYYYKYRPIKRVCRFG